MPTIKRPCRYPRCPALVDGSGYCPEHTRAVNQKRAATRTDMVFFNNKAWKSLRQEALLRDLYTCQRCNALRATGLNVHHIESREARPDLALVLSNLTTLCGRCHKVLEPTLAGRGG